ncbi:MAG: M24 family metallopeptidase [Spirochaetota bacterium]
MLDIYKNRVDRAQRLMVELGYELMVLFPGSNMRYLSGFYDEPGERMLFFLLPGEGMPVFLVPELYEQQLREVTTFEEIRVWRDFEGPISLLGEALKGYSKRRANVLIDDRMWAIFFLMLKEVMPRANFSPASKVMKSLRMVKTEDERNCLKRAGSIADSVYREVLHLRIYGMSELDIAFRIEEAMRREGAEGTAFETLVASGPNSALPHHRAGLRKIGIGDVVIFDYGCRAGGYCSDITRTVVCGKTTEEVKRVYEVVHRAQEKGVKAVKRGIPAHEIDRATRSEIVNSGYGEYFIHRTGHGIGLDVHEEPYIVEGNKLLLEEGMVFSVEPGVYIPGHFGVRIEDIVVVGSQGAERMNNASRTLDVVE